jgi:dTDP-4-dehydrorhamnose 3,5-epimerase
MKQRETKIDGCWLIEADRHFDERGFFQEIYSDKNHDELYYWKQLNWSRSKPNVLRGIHQAPYQKLFTCITGRVYDVVIDLRKDSETLYQWEVFELNGATPTSVLIPAGCGHGFFAHTEASMVYLQDDVYAPGKEKEWHWRSLPIIWPRARNYIISDRDKKAAPWPKL